MSWLVIRQHRWDAIAAAVVVFVGGGALILLAVAAASLAADISRSCTSWSGECAALRMQFSQTFGRYNTMMSFGFSVLPLLVGMFVGAPLASREFEEGTHMLVWTQGITRRRWFVWTAGLVLIGTLIATALFSVALQMWLTQQQLVSNQWYQFDGYPPVFIAYTIFAIALGLSLGALIQRTLPAMAATLLLFAAVRIAILQWARPNYQPRVWGDLTNVADPTSSPWMLGIDTADRTGHPISQAAYNQAIQQCQAIVQAKQTFHDCMVNHDALQITYYQPASRFWLFQSIEAAIFVALAAALLAVAYKIVMRKN